MQPGQRQVPPCRWRIWRQDHAVCSQRGGGCHRRSPPQPERALCAPPGGRHRDGRRATGAGWGLRGGGGRRHREAAGAACAAGDGDGGVGGPQRAPRPAHRPDHGHSVQPGTGHCRHRRAQNPPRNLHGHPVAGPSRGDARVRNGHGRRRRHAQDGSSHRPRDKLPDSGRTQDRRSQGRAPPPRSHPRLVSAVCLGQPPPPRRLRSTRASRLRLQHGKQTQETRPLYHTRQVRSVPPRGVQGTRRPSSRRVGADRYRWR
mmetsp:Transcript_57615/g.125250  ORF Transcript_57615/g.125250 Transcript_57615/m.125250 type:complete len:259 (+) Transcript_57615:1046-1822(+)